MTDPGPVPRPDLMLTAIGGGYLRNPVRSRRVTCADCTTPVDGYERCPACQSHHSRTGSAAYVNSWADPVPVPGSSAADAIATRACGPRRPIVIDTATVVDWAVWINEQGIIEGSATDTLAVRGDKNR